MKMVRKMGLMTVINTFLMTFSIILYQFDGIVKTIGYFGIIFSMVSCLLATIFCFIIAKLLEKGKDR